MPAVNYSSIDKYSIGNATIVYHIYNDPYAFYTIQINYTK